MTNTKKNRGFLAAALAVTLAMAAAVPAHAAAPQTASMVKLKSGITLHVVAQGDAAGPKVVLLHGVGDSWHSWDLVLPSLPAKYRVYAVSLRGHGLSDKPATGFSRKEMAQDVSDLIAEQDMTGVCLVGHSLGSFVAQEVAANDGGRRITRLVLVGSGPGGPRKEETPSELSQMFASIKDPVPEEFARDFQAGTAWKPLPPLFLETMIGEVLRVPARVWNELGRDFGTGSEPGPRLARIKAKTLLLWGDKDAMLTRADQDGLLAGIAGARLIVYPDTGHALHWEEPQRFARDLLQFLEQ
jgi:non-heme chloroperoxidase